MRYAGFAVIGLSSALLLGGVASVNAVVAVEPGEKPVYVRDESDPPSPQGPLFGDLVPCESTTDLDCIESISLITGKGRKSVGTMVRKGRPEVEPNVEAGSEEFGLVVGRGVSIPMIWRVPGLKNEYGTDLIRPIVKMTEPGVVVNEGGETFELPAGLKVELVPASSTRLQDIDDIRVPDAEFCGRPTKPKPCYKLASMDPKQQIEVVVRTSWLFPGLAQATLSKHSAVLKKLPSGGSRIVVKGAALRTPGFYFPGDRYLNTEQFDHDLYLWLIDFFDANDPGFPIECVRNDFPIVTTNASVAGLPYWDEGLQGMGMYVEAPHRDARGKVYRGEYRAQIPTSMAACLWDDKASRLKNQLVVEVVEQDGEEQVATTTVRVKKGYVRVDAVNFNFSNPTIFLKKKQRKD